MLLRANFLWFFVAIILLRLLSMAGVPLADTSEPRYAEIARLMMETNDWVTPWFEPGVPFWGKPPLSFWAQAASFKLLGVNELAVRLPSWLATLGTIFILWKLSISLVGRRVAQDALIIYVTSALVYISSGAVLTDPFLALGTTWAMAAFYLAPMHPVWYWRYGFFIGLAIGLLAKGPLALVLCFAPLTVWCLLSAENRQNMKALPWISGLLLTLLISLPWYIIAELKTPGFINYFIVGEHFMRFIDPGWGGDLYGSAHQQAKGMIWLQWVMASFPWGLIALALLVSAWRKPAGRIQMKAALAKPLISYLLLWSLVSPVFFTPAGNILWTYLLPSLAAFSLLLALGFDSLIRAPSLGRKTLQVAPFLTPVFTLVVLIAVSINPDIMKTEQDLVAFADNQLSSQNGSDAKSEPLFYLETKLPFSARFYSKGDAKLISMTELIAYRQEGKAMHLAVPKGQFDALADALDLPLQKLFENRRYILVEIPGAAALPPPLTDIQVQQETMQKEEIPRMVPEGFIIKNRDVVHDA